MTRNDGVPWTDRSRLREVQYRTDTNLVARQSLYRFQRPRITLPPLVLDLADLTGNETVVDVGCGNGSYLSELARRGHFGPVLGMDLSAGMLAAARSHAPTAFLSAGDAAALPLRDGISEFTLAAHMLYHVPEPATAVSELRRITRPGALVAVVLNGEGHLRELHDLVDTALGDLTGRRPQYPKRLRLDEGERLLAAEFSTVIRHDFPSQLVIPDPGPVEEYVRSMSLIQAMPDPAAVAAAVARLIPSGEPYRIRTHAGCLICC